MTIEIGKKIPAFKAQATSERIISSSQLKGKNVVLYFYPKDSTPGCTTEGNDFSKAYKAFQKENTEIIGISRDSLQSHDKFKCNQSFPFDLISDADENLCQLFDVIKTKKKFGKMSRGIERSTFLIDENQILRHVWRNVKVSEHVDSVLATVKELNK